MHLITFPPPSGVQSRALTLSGPVRGMRGIFSIPATVSSKKFPAVLEQGL